MNPFTAAHDASALRSDLAVFKPKSITPNVEKLDWIHDLSNVEHVMPEDEETCDALSHAGFAWMAGGEEGGISAKFKSNKLSSFNSEQSLYDDWLTTYTTGSCVDTRKLDKEFPHLFNPDVKKMSIREKIDQGISTAHEQIQISNLLSFGRSNGTAHYGRTYKECLGEADDHYGECMKLGSNGEVLKDYIQKRYCPASSVWVGPNLYLNEQACAEIALNDIIIDPDIPSVHTVGVQLKAKATINAVVTINDEKATLIATATMGGDGGGIEIGGEADLKANGWVEAWGQYGNWGVSELNAVAIVKSAGTGGTPSTSNSILNATSTISATGTGGTESYP